MDEEITIRGWDMVFSLRHVVHTGYVAHQVSARISFPRAKRPKRKGGHSSSPGTEVKHFGATHLTQTHTLFFMESCLSTGTTQSLNHTMLPTVRLFSHYFYQNVLSYDIIYCQ